jgi:hypothetical protein
MHLFLRSADAQSVTGVRGELWVPNPGATRPLDVDMYTFIGKLMVRAAAAGVIDVSSSRGVGFPY